ncbi:MAG: hypothetical protein F4X11_19230 [Acidobacteria bacterium]|nr:hypothetical protein [Acidobacteriota bacterium]
MATERIVRDRPGGQEPVKSTPENYPIATPPGLQAADHSWVLQTTMELQKSVGALTQAVATLAEQVKDQGVKLDAMRHEVTAAPRIHQDGWMAAWRGRSHHRVVAVPSSAGRHRGLGDYSSRSGVNGGCPVVEVKRQVST